MIQISGINRPYCFNIIPDADATYNLGSSSKTWNELNAKHNYTRYSSSAGPTDLKEIIQCRCKLYWSDKIFSR